MEFIKTMVLALLQLTTVCVQCQKFGAVYRRPVAGDKQIAARQQQQLLQSNYHAVQPAAEQAYQPHQPQQSAVEQFYRQQLVSYYPQQEKQLLEQQQQARLQQQQLQLQQLQQLQLQQPSSTAADYYQQQQQQQYNDFYLQQLQRQQQLQQQQQLQLQQQSQQQQYYPQKPLFRPAIPVNETPAEDQPQTASSQQPSGSAARPIGTDQQSPPPNLLGVLYSSAADVSKFQFSGNGVSYSF